MQAASMIVGPAIPAAVAALAVWGLLGAFASLGVPAVASAVRRVRPHHRSWLLLAYALYPLALGLSLAFAVFTPAVSALLVVEHCHGAACDVHIPVLTLPGSSAALIGVTVLLVGASSVGVLCAVMWRHHRVARMLTLLARPELGAATHLLDSDRVLACCAGVLRPTVLLSRGLAERATAEQMRVVLQHERAHGHRRDNLRTVLVAFATLVWLKRGRTLLAAEFRLAAEQSCDEVAAMALGNRRVVADTLVSLHAIRRGSPAPDPFLYSRLEALARDGGAGRPGGWFVLVVLALLLAQTALSADALHRLAEAVLRLF